MTLRHRPHRVLYVPLDDRPYNARVPRLLAQMVDYEIIMPPAEMLGCFRAPGQPEEIADWLRGHVDPALDCLVLSLDMLAFGGLWASRCPTTRTQLAQQRMEILAELRQAIAERRSSRPQNGPRLEDYLREVGRARAVDSDATAGDEEDES